jgi:nucleotide-binding universal stress UspA family protein
MSAQAVAAPIVVGVDARGSASDAVCWAAAEAATQHCPLRLVHAFHPPALINPYGVPPEGYELDWPRQAAEQVLRAAAALARSIAPDTEVSLRLHVGAAVPALLGEAARLLVVGHPGRSRVRGLLTGSVAIQVSARAGCPTVIVHPFHAAVPRVSSPRPCPLRVVVGVDATPLCAPAIGFAFHAAHQTGICLTAVHACPPKSLPGLRESDVLNSDAPDGDGPDDGGAGIETMQGTSPYPRGVACSLDDLDQELMVERAVGYWRTRYPDVPVVIKVVHDDPARALITEGVGAALLVVGSRGRGPVGGMLRASVSHIVLRCAASPVAVVGYRYTPPHADEPRPSASAPAHHPHHTGRERS